MASSGTNLLFSPFSHHILHLPYILFRHISYLIALLSCRWSSLRACVHVYPHLLPQWQWQQQQQHISIWYSIISRWSWYARLLFLVPATLPLPVSFHHHQTNYIIATCVCVCLHTVASSFSRQHHSLQLNGTPATTAHSHTHIISLIRSQRSSNLRGDRATSSLLLLPSLNPHPIWPKICTRSCAACPQSNV